MKRRSFYLLLAGLLVTPVFSQAPATPSKNTQTAPPKAKSFVDRVLEFLSISYTPGAQKSLEGDALKGQIWVANLKSNSLHPLSVSGDYRSPVFLASGSDVLALHGADVVRIPSTGGDGVKLYSVDGILKLVGAGSSDPNQILVLLRNDSGSHPRVGLLATETGTVTDMPYDPTSSEDLQMIEDLEGWSRTVGEKRVFVKRQSREDISGTLEWTDVFLIEDGRQPVDETHCEAVNCGQPSLSRDGNLLVFVKQRSE